MAFTILTCIHLLTTYILNQKRSHRNQNLIRTKEKYNLLYSNSNVQHCVNTKLKIQVGYKDGTIPYILVQKRQHKVNYCQTLKLKHVQYTDPTLNTRQKARRELSATSHEQELRFCCQATTTRCLCLPPPSRNSRANNGTVIQESRVPVLHNIQQLNAVLSAGCQLRRTGRLLTEFIGTSVRHLTHCKNPILAYSHYVHSFASCATTFFVKFCKRLITVVFCVRVVIIKQKTAYSDWKYEEVK